MVAEVMTREVVTVTPDTTVAEIVRTLVDRRIGAVPVVEADGRLIGMVSEADLFHQRSVPGGERRLSWADLFQDRDTSAAAFAQAHERTAVEVMTAKPLAIPEDTAVERVARLMYGRGIKSLPVVRDDRVVGIVARADLLRVLAMSLAPQDATCVNDMVIRDAFEARARAAGCGAVGAATAVVDEGVIHLWGIVSTYDEHRALTRAAMDVEGVRGIENHLAVREPVAGACLAPSRSAAPSVGTNVRGDPVRGA